MTPADEPTVSRERFEESQRIASALLHDRALAMDALTALVRASEPYLRPYVLVSGCTTPAEVWTNAKRLIDLWAATAAGSAPAVAGDVTLATRPTISTRLVFGDARAECVPIEEWVRRMRTH